LQMVTTMRNKARTPRVAVTLSPEAMKLLDELSAVFGQPKASLVSELIDSALPALQATVQAMAVAAEQPREAQRLMANYASRATMELSQQQLELDAAIDARTVKGKRSRRRADAAT
jgi:predicted DNA-binding protein